MSRTYGEWNGSIGERMREFDIPDDHRYLWYDWDAFVFYRITPNGGKRIVRCFRHKSRGHHGRGHPCGCCMCHDWNWHKKLRNEQKLELMTELRQLRYS